MTISDKFGEFTLSNNPLLTQKPGLDEVPFCASLPVKKQACNCLKIWKDY